MAKPAPKRCAIYTRKSSEEGLEQEYNSLDAQRDAAEAFVRSQKHEGWRLLKQGYDDGGISGGHMERPGLKELLRDIKAGRVDVVVVYKVDRLSRSLADFARLMDLFDEHKVSFVSVTQQFNTSTSMGRLTLNVLLSFAQFEREVTGERIRDKIALSKKKGKWMGGIPPLGYDSVEGKLKINPVEAEVVRTCFRLYSESSGLIETVQELNRRGLQTKRYVSSKGNIHEAKPWVAKQLHRLLTQPLYIGMVHHRNELFEGEHEAIVDRNTWDAVQQKLDGNRPENQKTDGHRNELALRQTRLVHPLKGHLYGVDGAALTPTYTNKRITRPDGESEKKRYRYYVSQNAIRLGDRGSPVTNLNATILENTVRDMLALALPQAEAHVPHGELTTEQLAFRFEGYATRIASIDSPTQLAELIRFLDPKIIVSPDQVQIHLKVDSVIRLAEEPFEAAGNSREVPPLEVSVEHSKETVVIGAKVRISSSRGRGELVDGRTGEFIRPSQTNPDASLIRTLAQAEFWRAEIQKHPASPLREVVKPFGIQPGYIRRLLNAAYLAPEIKRSIFQGKQPAGLQIQDLLRPIPMDWEAQKRMLGFADCKAGVA